LEHIIDYLTNFWHMLFVKVTPIGRNLRFAEKKLIGVEPLGVARSSQIHKICGGEGGWTQRTWWTRHTNWRQAHTHKIHTSCPHWPDSPTQ
jgi:hypothetical protein